MNKFGARAIHIGCNGMDSLRNTSIRVGLLEGKCSAKEYELIKKHHDRIRDSTAILREIANRSQKRSRNRRAS